MRGHDGIWYRASVWALRLAAAGLLTTYAATVASRAHLEVPTPTPMLRDRNGAYLGQLGHRIDGRIEYGYWTIDPPPDTLVRATLALEDRHFWYHPGVDPLALLRAAWSDLRSGRRVSGASTIAMQIARMQHPQARTLWAKAVEAGTAVVLTLRYGRRALLAHYLRLAPYGNGSHGVAHAARFYFDKPLADLDWSEIALLAAIPQAPSLNNPARPAGLARAVARARTGLAELLRQGVLPQADYQAALARLAAQAPFTLPRRPPEAIAVLARLQPLLTDTATPLVTASLDLALQRAITARLRRQVADWQGSGAQQAAAMVVRRSSMQVLAAVGSTGTGEGGGFDFTRIPRSPGSTLKPFLYALALDRDIIAPDSMVGDLAVLSGGIHNADGQYLGMMLPRQALANSRNVPAIELLRRIGLANGYEFLRALGVHEQSAAADRYGLTLAIGALPTSMDRLIRAYAALANAGEWNGLVWYQDQPQPPPRRVLAPRTAALITQFLSDPMARMPSLPKGGVMDYPFAVALKTGTSQGWRDAWIVAWSDKYLVSVWVGRADGQPMRQMTGTEAAGRLAQAILLHLHGVTGDALQDSRFPLPQGLQPAALCTATGAPDRGDCPQTLTEFVRPAAAATAAPATVLHLAIITPENNTHLWRNPELPAGLNRLTLRAEASGAVRQVIWYIDNAPFAVTAPDQPVSWPLQPGTHVFEVRMPYQEAVKSGTVRVTVE